MISARIDPKVVHLKMVYTAMNLARPPKPSAVNTDLERVRPVLTRAPGFRNVDLQTLIPKKERARLNVKLRELTTQRRRAEARTGKLRLIGPIKENPC